MRERWASTDIQQLTTFLLRFVVGILQRPKSAAYRILAEWEVSRDGKQR